MAAAVARATYSPTYSLTPYTLVPPEVFLREQCRIYATWIAAKELFPFPPLLRYIMPENRALEAENRARFTHQYQKLYLHCKKHTEPKTTHTVDHVCYHIDLRRKGVALVVGETTIFTLLEVVIVNSETNRIPHGIPHQDWTFVFQATGGERRSESYTLTSSTIVQDKFLCFAFLDGRELEISTPPDGKDRPNKEWDEWRASPTGARFVERIHPKVYYAFSALCCYFNHNPFRILELGGYEGRTSLKLLGSCSHIEEIICVDNHAPSIRAAQAIKACTCTYCDYPITSKNRFTPILADIRRTDFHALTRGSQVEVVLLVGVVAWGVLTRTESLDLLERTKKILKRGGIVVITAGSNLHFWSKDYKAMGYEVLNTNCPLPPPIALPQMAPEESAYYFDSHTSFYILRKW